MERIEVLEGLQRLRVVVEANEYGIEMLGTAISNRVAYAQALSDGVSVYQTRDGQERAEIDLVVAELENAGWL